MGLFRRYPRDYDQHVIAIWIFAITPLLAYYTYFSFYFAYIVNLIIPESALAISVAANAIFAFLVSRALYQEAEEKNQEMRKKIQFDSFQESEMAQQSALQSNSNQKVDSENSLKANPTLPIELHEITKTKQARAIQENLIDDDNSADIEMCIVDENGNMGNWLKGDDETYKKYVDVVNEMWDNCEIGENGEEI